MSTTTVTDPSTGQPVSKNRLLVTSGLGWMFDAMDVGLLSFILAALKADWGLSAGQMGWIGAINSIGMAVGAMMFGMLADRLGRKQVFIITLLLFKPRSWCVYCPMGTITQLICRWKHRK